MQPWEEWLDMATCSTSTLLSANPFTELSEGLSLACELELLRNWAGSTETPSEILAKAANSGFLDMDPGLRDAVECQLLCNISSP